ncbi:MAG: dihydrolipoamide acetyltransferase family protein [Lacisediminihabitans sp.]
MSIDVRAPTTGNSGEDAVIVDWNVSVGARVSPGDILVTLETAKAVIEVEAPAAGEVLKILYDSGDEVPEHAVLAILGEAGEIVADEATPSFPASDPVSLGTTSPANPAPSIKPAEEPTRILTQPETPACVRIKVSPRAAILAERNGIDLSGIIGSGPGGRLITADVLAERNRQRDIPTSRPAPSAAPLATASSAAPAPQPATPGSDDEFDLVPVRGARKVTAQRMQASLQSTAQVTLTRYADAGALLSYVARLHAVTDSASLPKIGVNDVLLFATARAVARHPEANATFGWDGIRRFRSVNLGFAVDTGQALLVPVIPGADRLSLSDLSAAARASIDKARGGKLSAPEMEGGTFTVSNLGGLGVHWFTPVLNPPQACILGVGATHQSHPDGPRLLPLSLTFDHRALDGAAAATVLADIAKSIETVDMLSAF